MFNSYVSLPEGIFHGNKPIQLSFRARWRQRRHRVSGEHGHVSGADGHAGRRTSPHWNYDPGPRSRSPPQWYGPLLPDLESLISMVFTLFWMQNLIFPWYLHHFGWRTSYFTYIPRYLHTYIPADLHTYIPADLHTYIPADLQTYMLPTNLPTYLPTYIHTYIHFTHITTYRTHPTPTSTGGRGEPWPWGGGGVPEPGTYICFIRLHLWFSDTYIYIFRKVRCQVPIFHVSKNAVFLLHHV